MSTQAKVSERLRLDMPASGSITRMALLALLDAGPTHGYQLRRELERRHMDRWANIRDGSIYPALRRLAEQGAIEVADTSRDGRLPERTTYRITRAGRAELRELLREALAVPHQLARAVDVAFAFINLLDSEQAAAAMQARIACLDAAERALDQAARSTTVPDIPGVKAVVSDLLAHSRLLVRAERAWARRVRDRVRTGVYDHEEVRVA